MKPYVRWSLALISATGLALPSGCSRDEPQESEPERRAVGSGRQAVTPPPGHVVLELDLPKAVFTGTPKDIRAENLEAPRKAGQPRPPLFVPEGVVNLAEGAEVTTNVPTDQRTLFETDVVTNADKHNPDEYLSLGGSGPRWIQIDLGRECEIFAVGVWHFFKEGRVYRDVIVQVGTDPDFILDEEFTTIFNNDHDNSAGLGAGDDKAYVDDHEGKLIPAGGVRGRYVRLYANGYDTSSHSSENTYVEVEVYGRPVTE